MFNIARFAYEFWLDGGEFNGRYVANIHYNRNVAINNWVYYIEQTYIILFVFRIVAPYIFSKYIQFDLLIYYIFANKNNGLDHCLIVAVLMCAINCFYLRHCFCSVRPNGFSWRYYYDIVCRSMQIYERHRLSGEERRKIISDKSKQIYWKNFNILKIFPQKFSKFVCNVVAELSLISTFEDLNRESMMREQLRTYPGITFQNRTKNISLIRMLERTSVIVFATLYFLIAIVLLIYGNLLRGHFVFALPIIILDLLMFGNSVDLLLRIAILCSNLSLIGSDIVVQHLVWQNRRVQFWEARRGAAIKRIGVNLAKIDLYTQIVLHRFLREHIRICIYTLRKNRELIRYAMFETWLVNIPVNVAFCARLLFQRLSPFEIAITVILILIQYITITINFLQASKLNTHINDSKRFLPTVIVDLDARRQWWLKMKFDSLYDRVTHRNNQYGITLGHSDRTLTPKLSFEILLIYFAYLMYGFSLVIHIGIFDKTQ